jgi:hypothetical protein
VRNPLLIATLIALPVLGVLVGLAAWNPEGNYWLTVEPPKAQCEAYHVGRLHTQPTLTPEIYDQGKLDRFIREPQNTVSNLPYAVVGLAILLAGRNPASFALGVAGLFLGFGSAMYHASLLPEWRMIDILGVYAVLYSLLLIGAGANFRRLNEGILSVALIILTWGAAIYTGIHRNDVRWMGVKLFDSTYVFVAAFSTGCVLALLAFRQTKNRTRYLSAVTVFAISTLVSFAGGLGDRFGGFWANPEFMIQGHAVWHAFGALSMLAIYEVFSAAGYDRSTLARLVRGEPAPGRILS